MASGRPKRNSAMGALRAKAKAGAKKDASLMKKDKKNLKQSGANKLTQFYAAGRTKDAKKRAKSKNVNAAVKKRYG